MLLDLNAAVILDSTDVCGEVEFLAITENMAMQKLISISSNGVVTLGQITDQELVGTHVIHFEGYFAQIDPSQYNTLSFDALTVMIEVK